MGRRRSALLPGTLCPESRLFKKLERCGTRRLSPLFSRFAIALLAMLFFPCIPIAIADILVLKDAADPLGARRPTAVPADLLILADGAKRVGQLSACTAASCTFDSRFVPLATIRWIGIQREGKEPPAASAAEDLIFVKDKPPVTARMSSIDATTVRTTRGSFARNDVTWIHVAPPLHETPTPTGAQEAAERATPPPPTPPSPKNTPPPSGTKPPTTQGPPRAGHDPVKPCPADKPLGGWVRGRETFQYTSDSCQYTVNTTLLFRLVPVVPALPWPSVLSLGYQAPKVDYVIQTDGCHQTRQKYPGEVCTTTPVKVSGSLPLRGSSFAHLRFEPATPGLEFLHLGASQSSRSECRWTNGFSRGDMKFDALELMVKPQIPLSTYERSHAISGSDQSRLAFSCFDASDAPAKFCTQPTVCDNATDPKVKQDCAMHADRYAVIPFEDEVNWSGPASHDNQRGRTAVRIRWKICCGCDEAGPPPEPSEAPTPAQTKPCPEVDSLINALKALKDQFDQTNRDHQKTVEQQDAIRDKVFGLDGAARKFFTSMLGLAGKGAGGLLSKVISVSKTLMDSKGPIDDAFKVFSTIAPDVLKGYAQAAAVSAAVTKADAYLEATGDDAGALRTYADSIGKSDTLAGAAGVGKSVAKTISIATGMIDYGIKASTLIDLMNKWSDLDSDATRMQNEMDDINRRMDELNKRIKEARDRCANRSSSLPRIGLVEPASYVFAEQGAGASDARGVAARLQQATEQLARVNGELEAAAPWLLPFMVSTTKPISTRLAADLLGQAVPHLEAVQKAIDDALATAKSVESELPNAIPGAAKSSSPPPKVGGESRTSRSR